MHAHAGGAHGCMFYGANLRGIYEACWRNLTQCMNVLNCAHLVGVVRGHLQLLPVQCHNACLAWCDIVVEVGDAERTRKLGHGAQFGRDGMQHTGEQGGTSTVPTLKQ